MSKSDLSPHEKEYYARHLLLKEIGLEGQLRLKNASVLIVGMGGLGSPAAMYLAASGVGRIGVMDFDEIDASNLHRQILYANTDVGLKKSEVAKEKLHRANPHVEIVIHGEALTAENARAVISKYDVIIDGTDQFETRYLINDACVVEKKPLVSAAIHGFEGQLSVFGLEGGPCYRCLYPEAPDAGTVPNCAENGVLGVLPGVMGVLQATETLKILAKIGTPLRERLLHYDALSMEFRSFKFTRRTDCSACGAHPTVAVVKSETPFYSSESIDEIEPLDLKKLLWNSQNIVIDVREPEERTEWKIEPSLHVPLKEFLASPKWPLFDGKKVVFYCQSGKRSLQAAQHLKGLGHANVLHLAGGMNRWKTDIK